jgi:dUTP pyrophosphatase
MSGSLVCQLFRIVPDVPAPSYAHQDDNGLDLCSAESLVLAPGQRRSVRLGFALALPNGYRAVLQSRSGLAAKQGVAVFDAPSPLLFDGQQEMKALLMNFSDVEVEIHLGDRIAQLVIEQMPDISVRIVDTLSETVRGTGGFGSSGR